jgi:adenylate kinase
MGLCHVSTGDLLRGAVSEGTDLGQKAKEYMERGELVSDGIVTALLKKKLAGEDCRKRGYVLDGYPRNLEQATDLEAVLDDLSNRLDAVVYIDVPRASIIERLSGRRVCPDCGAVYHLASLPPKTTGLCDACGGKLVHRTDDRPATIENRLKVYEESTRSLIEFYDAKGLLRPVEGGGEVNAIARSVFEKLKGDG